MRRRVQAVSNESMTRREWLARGAGAVVAAGAAAAGSVLLRDPVGDAGLRHPGDAEVHLPNFFATIDFPASSPRISVASGEGDNVGRLLHAAVSGLAPGLGMRRFVSPQDVVFLKPNVGFDRPPHLGATTSPELIRALIRLCYEAGARRVIVADNPIEAPAVCFAKSGIQEVARAQGAAVMLPSEAGFKTLVIRHGAPDPQRAEALGRWPVFYRPLAEATKVISAAPIKDHNLASASMNLKNWYGLLGGPRSQFHQAIHHAVSDLALMMSPSLVIADATRVMMRNGPTGGRLRDVQPGGKLGRPAIVASVDQVACDAWCYEHLLGRDPARLAYLDLAREKIAARIAEGEKRLGESDWRVYHRQGLIVTTSL